MPRTKSKGKEIEVISLEEELEEFRLSGGDGYETVDEEVGDTSGLKEEEEDSFIDIDDTRTQGVIRRAGLEGLLWWESGLRWLQGQGGGRGALCTVIDFAPRLIEKQGLTHNITTLTCPPTPNEWAPRKAPSTPSGH